MSSHGSGGGLVARLLTNSTLTRLWGQLPLPRRVRTAIIWLLNPKFSVGVVGLIRDEQDHILLLRHTYRPKAPWGLPGGGLRPGETLEDCLRRELREEAGLEVEVECLLSVAAHMDRRLVDMIFACRPQAGQTLDSFKPNAEVSEARYFPPDALPERMSRGQRRLIAVAIEQATGKPPRTFEPEMGEMP